MNTNLLLELIIFESQRLDIKSIINKSVQALVLEGNHSDLRYCSLIIKQGRMKRGDIIVASGSYCKILKIVNDRGEVLDEASAGMAIQVLGFKDLPKANDKVLGVPNEKEAKELLKLYDFFETVEEARSLESKIVEGTKIKFRNRRERRKFHSGKKEIVEQKYQSMLEDFIQKREELVEKGKDTSELDESIEKHREMMNRLISGDKTGLKIILKANDYGTLDTLMNHILKIRDSSGISV